MTDDVSAFYRLVNLHGVTFYVLKVPRDGKYCAGTWAQIMTPVPWRRVPCPVCGGPAGISPKNRVWAHYGYKRSLGDAKWREFLSMNKVAL